MRKNNILQLDVTICCFPYFPHFKCRHTFICVICPAFNSMYQMIQKIISSLLLTEITAQDCHLPQQSLNLFFSFAQNTSDIVCTIIESKKFGHLNEVHSKHRHLTMLSIYMYSLSVSEIVHPNFCKLDSSHPDKHMNLMRHSV